VRVFFPKYINRNRLFYKLEYDEWLVIGGTFFFFFYLLGFFLSFNILIAIGISFFVTKKIAKLYTEDFKELSPGFLNHFFYDLGLSGQKTKKNIKEEVSFPFGYETKFKD